MAYDGLVCDYLLPHYLEEFFVASHLRHLLSSSFVNIQLADALQLCTTSYVICAKSDTVPAVH